MEGVKRALVINPRLQPPVDRPDAVLAAIVASVQPPIDMPQPPPWVEAQASLAEVARMDWPPVRVAAP